MKALIQTTPLYTQAYEEIKKSILIGTIKPGSKIQVGKIAERLKISLTPIREALRQLQNEGLIQISKSGIITVIDVDKKDYEELCACRLMLEQEIIKSVIDEITEDELKSLENILRETEEAIQDNNSIEVLFLNAKFHERLVSSCSNKRYIQFLEQVRSLLLIYRANFLTIEEHDQNIVDEHWSILRTIKRRNVEEAVEVIKEHLNQDLKRGLKIFEEIDSNQQE